MNPPPADKCRSKEFYRFKLLRNYQSAAIPYFIIRYFLFTILRALGHDFSVVRF